MRNNRPVRKLMLRMINLWVYFRFTFKHSPNWQHWLTLLSSILSVHCTAWLFESLNQVCQGTQYIVLRPFYIYFHMKNLNNLWNNWNPSLYLICTDSLSYLQDCALNIHPLSAEFLCDVLLRIGFSFFLISMQNTRLFRTVNLVFQWVMFQTDSF